MFESIDNIFIRKKFKSLFMQNFGSPLNEDVICHNPDHTYNNLHRLISEQYNKPVYLDLDADLMAQRLDDELSAIAVSDNQPGFFPDFINFVAMMVAFVAILIAIGSAATDSATGVHISAIELKKDVVEDQEKFINDSMPGLHETIKNFNKVTDVAQSGGTMVLSILTLLSIGAMFLDARKKIYNTTSRRFYNVCRAVLGEKKIVNYVKT